MSENHLKNILFMLLPPIALLGSLTLGRYGLSIPTLVQAFLAGVHHASSTEATILWDIRLPRVLAAMLIGAALAVSGSAYQSLFRNPMISPDILGASAGSCFGAALAILCSLNIWMTQLIAFLMGLGAVLLTFLIAEMISQSRSKLLVYILTGMVISALFSAFISIIKYTADPDSKLPAITFWLMGSLSSITNRDLIWLVIPLIVSLIPLWLYRWQLDVLTYGEDEARSLGINPHRLQIIVIISSTLLSSASVSLCGMIGWVGLIIPHMARLVVGPNFQKMLPASMLIGSTFLLVVDNLARCLFETDIPLGIITAIIGAPFFIILLLKGNKKWL